MGEKQEGGREEEEEEMGSFLHLAEGWRLGAAVRREAGRISAGAESEREAHRGRSVHRACGFTRLPLTVCFVCDRKRPGDVNGWMLLHGAGCVRHRRKRTHTHSKVGVCVYLILGCTW